MLSSPISLGLLDGLTDVISRSTGLVRLDVRAIGTTRDPHFDGFIESSGVGFLVSATGSLYKNGRAVFRFSRERVEVDALHIEDANGRPLDVSGSLATHELKVANLSINARDPQLRGRSQPVRPRVGRRRPAAQRPVRVAADRRRPDDR